MLHIPFHTPLWSWWWAAVNKQERHGHTLWVKEIKSDIFRRKIYSTGGLQLCIANQQAIPSQYSFKFRGRMSRFVNFGPLDSKSEFSALMDEGKDVARTLLQVLLDSVDVAVCTMSLGIVVWCCFWESFNKLYKAFLSSDPL